ncbi:MAG: DNA repair protein RecO [Clostridia bacterium]|nr:DNA repair protein RecO [Clostridia bacterium]
MAEKVKAIVIKSNDRKEKDKNILLFSLEKGKVWATLRSVKSPSAKMKTAQNAFAFGEFMLEEGKSGWVVTGFESIESFREIPENIDKYFEASAVLEVINQLEFSSGSECAKVFVLTLKTLKTICFGKAKENYSLCKFFIELFKITGSPLFTTKCSCCGNVTFDKLHINYSIGELVCSNCKNLGCEELSKVTFQALKILDYTDFDRLETLKLAEGSQLALLKILCKNFDARFSAKLKLMGILS